MKGNVYDAGNKQISNVSDPINNQDASTKLFVLNEIDNKYKLFTNELNNNLIVNYLSSDNKLFDAKNRRISNVDDPIIYV